MTLKIVCWYWQQPGGRVQYKTEHIRIWADMIRRNLSTPHSLAVVTDIPGDYGIEVIQPPGDFLDVSIPTWRMGRPQCFRRLAMFRPDAAQLFGADVLVQLDLDVVVTGALDPLFAGGEDFRICAGTAGIRAYNGSMYMLRCGTRTKAFTEFTPQKAAMAGKKHVGSDQSWIAHILPGEKTWKPADGVVPWQIRHHNKAPRLVTFPGAVKPWSLARFGAEPTIFRHYRRSPNGRALVLGYGPTLWRDVEVALDGPAVDAVIASPEAARHWPGDVLAIADDDEDAECIAALHGLEPVWCGRTEEATDAAAA